MVWLLFLKFVLIRVFLFELVIFVKIVNMCLGIDVFMLFKLFCVIGLIL